MASLNVEWKASLRRWNCGQILKSGQTVKKERKSILKGD